MRASVKIEVNFYDAKVHPYQEKVLGTYLGGADLHQLEPLYEERYQTYTTPVELTCHDRREIFIEKCRAMMTRKVYKPRDPLDLYHMSWTLGYTVPEHKDGMLSKVRFALDTYESCSENIVDNDLSKLGYDHRDDNLPLMIMPEDIEGSIGRTHKELESIRKEIVPTEIEVDR